ncbi:hypothetical protein RD792_008896 [Penstemon davidsonii]|uniref:U2A'/phosphoprotein 32 family A C-terminal domain-containing protein n=2 Tax=Penstemon davidsonii TaxID=160366 RepID=A0ABR0DAE5_9LAMI|nr:hypothetical protein RD792_008896 [Penstemon davidsonii]
MVRITADLIWKSPHFFNALRERELDLRGNKISVIENIGATEDQFDTIDLSDNEIVKLENFPYLNRLGTLLLNNNRITRINPNLEEYLPKLHTLVLTNNRLTNLIEIDPLASLPKLQFLSLLDNNITKKPNYRLYVIHKLKSLRVLDFRKVKQKERAEANKLFASKEAEEEAKRESVKTVVPNEIPSTKGADKEEQTPKPAAPTPEQILAIKAAIVNSQTLEEVARLEQALKSGQLPADFNINDSNSVTKSEGARQDDMITDEKEANDEPKDADSEQKNDGPADMQEKVLGKNRLVYVSKQCSSYASEFKLIIMVMATIFWDFESRIPLLERGIN